jgi:hypothetical protein
LGGSAEGDLTAFNYMRGRGVQVVRVTKRKEIAAKRFY